MNVVDIALAINSAKPAATTFKFKTETFPRLRKTDRSTGAVITAKISKTSEFEGVVGLSYTDEVNKALPGCDFVAGKPYGKHYVKKTNWLMESDTTPGKFYIAIGNIANRKDELAENGQKVDAARALKLERDCMVSAKQSQPVQWRTFSIDSIKSIEIL